MPVVLAVLVVLSAAVRAGRFGPTPMASERRTSGLRSAGVAVEGTSDGILYEEWRRIAAGAASMGEGPVDRANQARAKYASAVNEYERGDFERAQQLCREAMLLNVNLPEARDLERECDFIVARSFGLTLDPELRDRRELELEMLLVVKVGQGKWAYESRRYEEAEAAFEEVIEMAKDLPQTTILDVSVTESWRLLAYARARS
jgi:tetratricopeptide (TPR) repeat protein